MGNSETVSLLMNADCSLDLFDTDLFDTDLFDLDLFDGWPRSNVLEQVIRLCSGYSRVWNVPQEARMDVLDTVISLLAERRRNLQSRLAALSAAVTINPKVFQDDRILDEYAQYAERIEEDAMRGDEHMPRHASSLLPDYWTVYHSRFLTVEIAEKLWQNGFRDIDVPDAEGITPLMNIRYHDVGDEIEFDSWLIQKGANLHRLQRRPQDYDADPTISDVLPPVIRALHFVACHIGYLAGSLAYVTPSRRKKQPLEMILHRLGKEARSLAASVFLDDLSDSCICACSSQGCLASTMMLRSFVKELHLVEPPVSWYLLSIECLIEIVGPNDQYPDWLVKEIIRFMTFKELELRHTCCERLYGWEFRRRDPEEQAEIRDEDHEKIELLESLLQEFEERRGTQDVLSFFEGYWAMRMDQVHREGGHVDKEALREIGVILREDEVEEIDGEGSDEEGSDEDGSDDTD